MPDKGSRSERDIQKLHAPKKSKLERIIHHEKEHCRLKTDILQQSENGWENTFNAISDWVVLTDLECRILKTNKSGEKFTGLSSTEMIGRSCCDLTHGSAKRISGCPMEEMIRTGRRAEAELRLPDDRWFLVSVDPFEDEHGKTIAAVHIARDITRQKKAEETLKGSEEKFRNIFEHANDGIAYLDRFGKILDVNEKVLQIFGGTRRELINKHFTKLGILSVREIPGYVRMFQGILAGNEPTVTLHIKNKKGRKVFLECSASLIKPNGESARIMVIARDVTKRKKAEDELRLKDMAIATSINAIAIADLNGILNYVNSAFLKMWGYDSAEDILGKSTEHFWQMPGGIKERLKALHRGGGWIEEGPAQRKDNSLFIVQLSTNIVTDDSGKLLCMMTSFIDVTERRLAEKNLRSERDRAQKYLDVAGVMIVAVDSEGRVGLINKKGCEILGYKENEILCKNWFDNFLPERNRESVRTKLNNVIKGRFKPDYYAENIVLTKAGQEKIIGWHNTVLKDTNGRTIGVLSSGEDITDRKRAEQALREAEAKYRKLFENLNVGIYRVTPGDEGKFIDVNPAYVSLLGYENKEEVLKLRVSDTYADPSQRAEYNGKITSNGFVKNVELLLKKKDGTPIVVSDTGTAVYDNFGKLVCFEGILDDITARKKVEEALRKSEEHYRLLAETMNDGLTRIDENGIKIYVNKKSAEIFGYSPEEMLGKHWTSFYDKDSRHIIKEQWNKRKRGIAEAYEILTTRKDGRKIYLRISPQPIFDESGVFKGSISILTDFTERRKTEDALKQSEEKFYKAFQTSPNLMAITTIEEGRIIEINEAFCRIIGYSSQECIGHTTAEINIWEDPELRTKLIERIKTKGRIGNVEAGLRTRSGRIRKLIFSMSSITLDNEKYLLSVATDITERKKAEEALKESEHRFKMLFECAPDGIYLNDMNGNFVDGNRTAEKLIGYKREELIGSNFAQAGILLQEEIPKALARLEKNLNGQSTGPDEFTLIHKDGSHISVEIRSFPVKIGNQILTLGIARDITERKRAEEALKDSENKYRELANSITDVFFAMDTDLRYTYWNKASESLTGIKAEDALGKTVFEIFPATEDIRKSVAVYKDVLKKKQPKSFENKYQFNGKHYFFEINVYPNKDGISVFVKDITERKNAEQKEQEYIRQLQYLSESATEFIRLTPDQDIYSLIAKKINEFCEDSIVAVNTFDEVSDRLCVRSVVGLGKYTQAVIQVMGTNPVGQYFPLDDAAREGLGQGKLLKVPGGIYDLSPGIPRVVCQAIEKLLGLGDVYAMGLNSEGCLYGSVTILTRSKTGLENHELIETFMNQAAVAIRRQESNLALRESEERFRALFEKMPSGVAVYESVDNGNDFIFRDFNNSAEKIDKVKREELIGKRVTEAFPGIKEFGLFEVLKHVWKTGKAEFFPGALYKDDRVSGTWRENWIYKLPSGRIVAVYNDITERKRAEEALKDSELKFRLVTETIEDIFWMSTCGVGKIIYISPTYETLFQRSRESLYQAPMSFLEAVHPDDLEGFLEVIDKYHKNGKSYEYEYRIIRKEGEIKWIRERGYPVPQSFNDDQLMTGVCTDITERKSAEDALKREHNLLRLLIDNIPDKIYVKDVNHRFILGNSMVLKYVGFQSEEELLGKTDFDLYPEESAKRFYAVERDIIQKCQPLINHEELCFDKQGEEQWNLVTKVPLVDENENIIGIVGINRNITEHKEAEEALHRQRVELQTILDSVPAGIWYKDSRNRLIKVNKTAAQSICMNPEDIEGKLASEIFPHDDADKYYRDDLEVIKSGKPKWSIIEQLQVPGGQRKWVHTDKVPYMDEQGNVTGIIVFVLDITERRLAEEALRQREELLRATLESTADGILVVNERGQFTHSNARMMGMWRIPERLYKTKDEAKLLPFIAEQLIDPKDFLVKVETLYKSNDEDFDTLIFKDGRVFERYSCPLIQEGRNTGRVWSFRDVTEQKQIELRLEKETYLNRTLLDALPSVALLMRPRTREIVASNKAAIDVGAVPGKTCYATWAQRSGPCPWCLAPKVWEKGKSQHLEVEYRGIVWDAYWIPVSDDLYMHFAFDITVRKKAEEDLLKYQEQLKSMASQLMLTEEHERRRIAIVLHDQIGQSLAVSKIRIEELLHSDISKDRHKVLKDVRDWLSKIISDTRSLTFDLSSPILYELGFEKAVAAWLEEEIQRKHNIITEFRDDEKPKPLGENIRMLLFRDVRELLINIVKHAHAKKVTVSVNRIDSMIQVTIEDDGVGFEPSEVSSVSSTAFGLFSIRERLEHLGGEFNIDSSPDCGCKVTLLAPIDQDKNKAGDKK